MKVRKNSVINLFYLPAILLFLVFVIYPFIQGIRLSFTNWNGYSQSMKYVGIKNYIRLFQDANVKTALVNTLIYGIMSTVIQNILGLGYAMFLNTKFKGRSLVRTIIYMPVMIAPLIMGYIMYFFFQYDGGAVNDILIALGMQPVDLLVNSNYAIVIIVLVNSLQFVGVAMVIYLANLQSISPDLYEAADIDGAGGIKKFFYVTLPLMCPSVKIIVVTGLIGGMKVFDIIYSMTSGGPGNATETVMTVMMKKGISDGFYSTGSAFGVCFFAIVLVISAVVTKLMGKWSDSIQ